MKVLLLFLSMVVGYQLYGQSLGGGIWLEKDASCLGSVISINQAVDGFGVAGGNASLINCTVTGNKELRDTTYYPKPGDIYCADGKIVDIEAYKLKEEKNAIGIVFWINGDPEVKYPQGAVVALEQSASKLKWGYYMGDYQDEEGKNTLWLSERLVENVGGGGNFAFLVQTDTFCYLNTKWMVDWQKTYPDHFQAGPYCWEYKAFYQKNNPRKETKDIRWCMPTLMFLKRMVVVYSEIYRALTVIQEGGLNCMEFKHGEFDFYWSANDGITENTGNCAWTVGFSNGKYSLNAEDADKGLRENWVRPIFLYGERE